MEKRKIEIIITSVMIIILIFAIPNAFKAKKEYHTKVEPIKASIVKTSQPKKTVSKTQNQPSGDQGVEERMDSLNWDRDPFAYRPVASIGIGGGLNLEGIVWDEENPKAMVDGTILGIDEKIGDYTIVDITKDGVLLTDGTKQIELKL